MSLSARKCFPLFWPKCSPLLLFSKNSFIPLVLIKCLFWSLDPSAKYSQGRYFQTPLSHPFQLIKWEKCACQLLEESLCVTTAHFTVMYNLTSHHTQWRGHSEPPNDHHNGAQWGGKTKLVFREQATATVSISYKWTVLGWTPVIITLGVMLGLAIYFMGKTIVMGSCLILVFTVFKLSFSKEQICIKHFVIKSLSIAKDSETFSGMSGSWIALTRPAGPQHCSSSLIATWEDDTGL